MGRPFRPPARWMPPLAMLALIVLSGCISSPGRARYTAHRTHRLEPAATSPDAVLFAFGLEGRGRQHEALARTEDE